MRRHSAIEGYRDPDDIDAEDVHLYRFRATDPTGQEQAEREADRARAGEMMGPPRRFRMEGGVLREITGEGL